MSLIVQKYGGTSVADVDRIMGVADRVESAIANGHQVLVVVSAMAGETNRLEKLAQEVCSHPEEREMDLLLSSGERVTSALLALVLQDRGHRAKAYTGRQVGIMTNSRHTRARIERITAERIQDALQEGILPVVAGFQGINEQSDVTTLGRGGSDLTAVALAAALKADFCDIYTDVEGIYTADPSIVSDARRLEKISYDEMLEMASLGAKVLQTRSVEFAAKYQVPVRVRSSLMDGLGTLVTKEDQEMEQAVVSGVTYDKNQAKVTILGVPDQPGIAAKLFSVVGATDIVVDMIIQNVSQEGLTDISFTIPKSESRKAMKIVNTIATDIGAQGAQVASDIANVSIIGVGMKSHSGVAGRMFSALSDEGINIMMISTSEIRISCVIEEKYTELAVRTLHHVFELADLPKG